MLLGKSITSQHWLIKLHMRHGLVKNPLLNISEFFGCDAYVHVPKENRSKLDNKDEKCIFIGYKDGIKGYKLWNPITKKIVYS
jgi:hypothetical protein